MELCSGVGACRKRFDGAMCPSYRATMDERHTTRARANMLRAVLSGALPPEELTGEGMHAVMDLCLQCKACKAECPSNVDMAKLKAEYLAHANAAHGTPLRARMFGHPQNPAMRGSIDGELTWPTRWAWSAGSAPACCAATSGRCRSTKAS